MKKEKNQKIFFAGIATVIAFILWTAAVSLIDVKAIGPQNSSVGFAAFNGFVHDLTGVHMALYTVTDWLGLVPLCFILGFALLGLIQLIKRKSLFKVDSSILVLGVFYIVVMVTYIFFELNVVNYRPILIEGYLEASYPSSTTMLVMCVMPTAVMQLNSRIKNPKFRKAVAFVLNAFTAFMVIVRLISGVHWITDIIGGAILSTGLVSIYYAVTKFIEKPTEHP
ncbi:MAG: phosphatase PAP2 family protein [Oscillospiraceae bacterium]